MKYRYLTIAMYALLIAAICCLAYYFTHTSEVSVENSDKINITPQQVMEIKNIGQWEFLNVCDEEVIDTIHKRMILSDDRLVRIYYGTMRLGVDLTKASDSWIENHNDTITVTLPPPGLLDENFIDEARTMTFYESGQWSGSAKEEMYSRAKNRMKKFALTKSNIDACRKAARTRFENLFMALGAKSVTVKFEDE